MQEGSFYMATSTDYGLAVYNEQGVNVLASNLFCPKLKYVVVRLFQPSLTLCPAALPYRLYHFDAERF